MKLREASKGGEDMRRSLVRRLLWVRGCGGVVQTQVGHEERLVNLRD